MDLDTFKNPYVIGGGLLIGVMIMLVSGSKSSSGVPDSGPSAAELQYAATQNAAGMNYASQMAGISADLAGKRIDSSTTIALAALSYMQSAGATNAQQEVQDHAISAQVTQTRIQNETSLLKEYDDNATRLSQSYISADVSKHATDVQSAVARMQMLFGSRNTGATGASSAAPSSSSSGLGSLISSVGSLFSKLIPTAATTAVTGGLF